MICRSMQWLLVLFFGLVTFLKVSLDVGWQDYVAGNDGGTRSEPPCGTAAQVPIKDQR